MNLGDFLNADSDTLFFGGTDVLLFDLKMQGVHCSYICFSLTVIIKSHSFNQSVNHYVKCRD